MNRFLFSIVFYITLLSVQAQNAVSSEVNRLKTDAGLVSAAWGFKAVNLQSGELIAEHNAQMCMVPASVMKTVTTAAALEILGENYTFKTRYYIRGEVSSEGILNGDFIIRGGGDPTFGSEENSGLCASCVVNEALLKLRERGVKVIAGDILADDTFFEELMTPGGWNWSDIGNRYGAAPSGLTFADNTIWYKFKSGREGRPAEFIGVRPYIPSIKVRADVVAGGSGDNAYVYGAEYSEHRYINGRITPNQTEFEVHASMPDPPYIAALTFYQQFIDNGLYVTGLPRNARRAGIEINYTQATEIGSIVSPPLSKLVALTNKPSNNLYAEHLHKAISAKTQSEGSNKGSNSIIESFWVNLGLSSPQLFMTDGSGLSRSNAVSPNSIVKIFEYMYKSSRYKTFYESLSIAGVDGTLRNLCKGTKAANNVHAKSGTMSRVKSYAGYVQTQSGKTIAFCVMANNYSCSTSELTDKMERLMIKMAELP